MPNPISNLMGDYIHNLVYGSGRLATKTKNDQYKYWYPHKLYHVRIKVPDIVFVAISFLIIFTDCEIDASIMTCAN